MANSSSSSLTILLVGGGSGGHMYPNLAVAERLPPPPEVNCHLVVSTRPLDAQIAEASGLGFTALSASPLSVRPRGALRFWRDFCRGRAEALRLIEATNAAALIATGGFVSGPAVAAAKRAGIAVALISLDAVPGRANRFTARQATAVFSAFETHADAKPLPRVQIIGFPLRRAAVARAKPQAARKHFGLDPDRPTLLVFAGSQGARTINQAIDTLKPSDFFKGWQVLHIRGPEQHDPQGRKNGTGPFNSPQEKNGPVPFVTVPFCDRMDLAWAATDLAVTRCGAGTVAEAWANAVPGVMLPYPFHKDQHQKHNAAPLVDLGGAVVLDDRIDPAANAASLTHTLGPLLHDASQRRAMRQALRDHPPPDGAARLADWVRQQIDRSPP